MIHPDFPRVKAPGSLCRVLAASSPWSLHVLAVSSPWSLLGLGAPGWAQLIPLTPGEVPSSTPFQRGSTGMLLPHPKRGRGCSAPIPERSRAPVVFQWDDSNHLPPKYSHSPPGLGLGWLHTLHPTLSLHSLSLHPRCPSMSPNVPSCSFSIKCWEIQCWRVWGPGRACGVTRGALGDSGMHWDGPGWDPGSSVGALGTQELLRGGAGPSRGGCGANPD